MFIRNAQIKNKKVWKLLIHVTLAVVIVALFIASTILCLQVRKLEESSEKNISYPSVWHGVGNLTSYRLIAENVYDVQHIKTFTTEHFAEFTYQYFNDTGVSTAVASAQYVRIYGRLVISYTVDLNCGVVITKNGSTTPIKDFVEPEIPDVVTKYTIPETVIYNSISDIDINDCMIQANNTPLEDAICIYGDFNTMNNIDQTLNLNVTVGGNTYHITKSN